MLAFVGPEGGRLNVALFTAVAFITLYSAAWQLPPERYTVYTVVASQNTITLSSTSGMPHRRPHGPPLPCVLFMAELEAELKILAATLSSPKDDMSGACPQRPAVSHPRIHIFHW